jgi:hypothetical protein
MGWKSFETRGKGCFHSFVNTINTDELYTIKRLIVCYANFNLIKKKDKCTHTLILIKFIPLSRATTPASKVFPVPGGPYNSIPVLWRMGKFANNSGYYKIIKIWQRVQIWTEMTKPQLKINIKKKVLRCWRLPPQCRKKIRLKQLVNSKNY